MMKYEKVITEKIQLIKEIAKDANSELLTSTITRKEPELVMTGGSESFTPRGGPNIIEDYDYKKSKHSD